MKLSRPLALALPISGVVFAESEHAPQFLMAERVDPFHKIIYVLNGAIVYRDVELGSENALEAGSVVMVPRNTRHVIADTKPSTLLLLCLSEHFLHSEPELSKLWCALTHLRRQKVTLGRPGRTRIEGLWRWALLETNVRREIVGSGAVIKAIAVQMIAYLARLPSRSLSASVSGRVKGVLREIDETFYDDWDLNRGATRAGLSRRRFSQLFREASGETFAQRITRIRLEHAARLLHQSTHSVSGVTFSCGFNDLSNFHRLFQKRFGTTPRKWRALKKV